MLRTTLAAGLVLALAGCSGGSGVDGLTSALDQVKDTKATRMYVEYGNHKALREALGTDDPSKVPEVGLAAGMGFSAFEFKGGGAQLELKAGESDMAVLAGSAGVGLVQGPWNADKIRSAFAKRKTPTSGPDPFRATKVADSSFAYARSKADLALIQDVDGRTLAESGPFKAVAGCLGDDVTAAMITGFEPRSTTGAGVMVKSRTEMTEIACIYLPDGKDLEKKESKVRAAFKTGKSVSGTPWNDLLEDVQVEADTENKVIKISGTPAAGRKAGLMFMALRQVEFAPMLR